MPTPPNNTGLKIRKLNAFTYGKLIAFMLDGIYTCRELADLTGLHEATVNEFVRELHNAKAVHIIGWEQDARGRFVVKVFKVGRGKDVARPPRLTEAERTARYRHNKKLLVHQAAASTVALVSNI